MDERFNAGAWRQPNEDPGPSDSLIPPLELSDETLAPISEALAIAGAERQRQIEEARDFGRALAAYWAQLAGAGLPPQAIYALAREWQQIELTKSANIQMMHERLDREE